MSPSEQAAAVLLRRLEDKELRRAERAKAAAHLAKLADGILSAHAPVSLRAGAFQWAAKASAALVKVREDVAQLVKAQRATIAESCSVAEWARAAAIWCAAALARSTRRSSLSSRRRKSTAAACSDGFIPHPHPGEPGP